MYTVVAFSVVAGASVVGASVVGVSVVVGTTGAIVFGSTFTGFFAALVTVTYLFFVALFPALSFTVYVIT